MIAVNENASYVLRMNASFTMTIPENKALKRANKIPFLDLKFSFCELTMSIEPKISMIPEIILRLSISFSNKTPNVIVTKELPDIIIVASAACNSL
jgi:hypothetical protein